MQRSCAALLFLPLLLLLPLVFCQCKVQTVDGEPVSRKKSIHDFTDWDGADATWYAEADEPDPKKRAEMASKRKRTSFEKRVLQSRDNAIYGQTALWQDKRYGTDSFAGQREKKTFRWPWQKKPVGTENFPTLPAREADTVSRSADGSAREDRLTSLEADDTFNTTGHRDADKAARTSYNYPAEKARKTSEGPNILNDRGETQEIGGSGGWGIGTVARFLGKLR